MLNQQIQFNKSSWSNDYNRKLSNIFTRWWNKNLQITKKKNMNSIRERRYWNFFFFFFLMKKKYLEFIYEYSREICFYIFSEYAIMTESSLALLTCPLQALSIMYFNYQPPNYALMYILHLKLINTQTKQVKLTLTKLRLL